MLSHDKMYFTNKDVVTESFNFLSRPTEFVSDKAGAQFGQCCLLQCSDRMKDKYKLR